MTLTLRARGLSKSFGALPVVDGVDLDAEPGRTVALLGPSGCGKSTLLRLLAGFERPDAGTVLLGDEPVTAPSPRLGMVSQNGGLFPWLTVRANLAYGPRAAGRRDALAVADRLVEDTGLTGFADALPRALSGGMRQRAAIAQVLATAPPVLLLDEPFGALDAQTRLRMQEWLRGLLAARPTTVVLVTHDVDEALLLGDRILVTSARPMTLATELAVPFGTSRGRKTLADRRFVELKQQVLELVLDS